MPKPEKTNEVNAENVDKHIQFSNRRIDFFDQRIERYKDRKIIEENKLADLKTKKQEILNKGKNG